MKRNIVFVALVFIALALTTAGGLYLWQTRPSQPPAAGITQEPLPSAVPPETATTTTSQPSTTSPTPTTTDATANWKTWTNKTNGYEFKYPDNWFINPNNGSEMLSDISLEGAGYPDYVINFNVDVRYPYRVGVAASIGTKKEIGDKVSETKIADLTIDGNKAAKFQIDVLPGSRTDAHNSIVIKIEFGSKYLYIEYWKEPSRKNTAEINGIFDQILTTFKFLQ